jgi:hypothetical protein
MMDVNEGRAIRLLARMDTVERKSETDMRTIGRVELHTGLVIQATYPRRCRFHPHDVYDTSS